MVGNTLETPPKLPSQPRQSLGAKQLATLNQKSNLQGLLRLGIHLSIMAISGYCWAIARTHDLLLAIPALIVYGASIATMFAPLHECVHRTAFASRRLSDGVAWLAGLLSFYNSTFFRRYHQWHHRYTQIPGKDPELCDPKPTNLLEYIWQISGLPWWLGKIRGHFKVATGQLEEYFFLPESVAAAAIRSTRLQLVVYGGAIALSMILGHPLAVFWYWVLPLAVGQPLLRYILLAEHTNCTLDDNPLTNTRTTLTLLPIRLLMWNMPFHVEHHLYPSIPFHQLPTAHQELKQDFVHLEPGYIKVNRDIVGNLEQKNR
ncbi:MAG: fatty acid desaturase family protein [Jaaginema sp. PMC 1079.18]|nr:fatty acid desaturase family protein [Jaaginema sp. PMC 1080.18]MEC4852402.1 fatty acid desaturase family protein [Jaaginema sp. PMC 1079.18]MEC4867321.1 fatty acid desaturase family protein [Jaaginema sp. PMC 1078.18]